MPDEKKEDELESLKNELEEIRKKAEEYLSGWKRAKADYLNLKKDHEKHQVELIQFANAALLVQLLPIFDHYKLAIKHIPSEHEKTDWARGFIHVKKQIEEFLKNLGIEEIKTVGEKFNPEYHEAVSHEEKKDFAPETVFEEVQAGYFLYGKVIKPAKVKVTK